MITKRCGLALVSAAFLILAVKIHAAPAFQGLGDLPGGSFRSEAIDVSANGLVVVGHSRSASGQEAFRWTRAGGMVGLGQLPGGSSKSQASGISADGSVAAGYAWSTSSVEAFRWTKAEGMVGLGYVPGGGSHSEAHDVSANGLVVVGESRSASAPYSEAFRWTQTEGMVGLGDLPGADLYSAALAVSADGLVVVGFGSSGAGLEAFRWQSDVMAGLGDLPGGSFHSCAADVSADGSVVVGQSTSASGKEAFRWTEAGGIVGLGDLPGGDFYSSASTVSADGSIVLGSSKSAIGHEAFIWDASHGMRSLKDVLEGDFGVDLTGWKLTWATGISGDGSTIVGYGTNGAGNTEGWIVTIPEPAVSHAPDAPVPDTTSINLTKQNVTVVPRAGKLLKGELISITPIETKLKIDDQEHKIASGDIYYVVFHSKPAKQVASENNTYPERYLSAMKDLNRTYADTLQNGGYVAVSNEISSLLGPRTASGLGGSVPAPLSVICTIVSRWELDQKVRKLSTAFLRESLNIEKRYDWPLFHALLNDDEESLEKIEIIRSDLDVIFKERFECSEKHPTLSFIISAFHQGRIEKVPEVAGPLYEIDKVLTHHGMSLQDLQLSTEKADGSQTDLKNVTPNEGMEDIKDANDVIVNSIGMELRYIKPGEFWMGSSANEKWHDNSESPRHRVKLTKGFYIGLTEITQAQWVKIMNTRPWLSRPFVMEDGSYPVAYVSWNDAVLFCKKLSEEEGREYRLPTEAEWEYACRAGSETAFSFGDDSHRLSDFGWFVDIARFGQEAGDRYARRVAQKQPNPWGLYDMHGNVGEWCYDRYGSYPANPVIDPKGPSDGEYHLLRGGSWLSGPEHCRSAGRKWNKPGGRYGDVGFRVVLDLK